MDPSTYSELTELLPSGLRAVCQEATAPKGARLFTEGKVPKWMFYVTAGEIALIRNGVNGETAYLQRRTVFITLDQDAQCGSQTYAHAK